LSGISLFEVLEALPTVVSYIKKSTALKAPIDLAQEKVDNEARRKNGFHLITSIGGDDTV
jgi:hypothetical protein